MNETNKIEIKFWHIVTNDGKYISRQRWATRESAQAELDSCPETWPRKDHKVVEITYSFEV